MAELFDAHAPMVLGLCRSLLRDPNDGEDAAQQTFVSAYASIIGGTRPRDSGAWLATIARNECRTRIRRRMREPLPLAEAGDALPAPEAVGVDDVESLRLALANLPRQQRRAFLLRELSGFSYEELAQALGVSLPAVESLLFRARRQLRTSLRSAAATTLALPAAARDFLAQASTGTGESPAALAKLGSAPLLAKLASVGAGAALMTAGAVAVAPANHGRATPKPTRAVAAPARASHVAPAIRRASIVRAVPVAVRTSAPAAARRRVEHEAHHGAALRSPVEDRNASESERRTPAPVAHDDHSGDSTPLTQPGSGDAPTVVAEESSGPDFGSSDRSSDGGSGSSGSGGSDGSTDSSDTSGSGGHG